jgi:hypothetical protein
VDLPRHLGQGAEQRRLAEPPRRPQARGLAGEGKLDEALELGPAIDELGGGSGRS